MSRTGEGYIGDLRDARCVCFGGDRVAYVPDHRSLRNAAATSVYLSAPPMLCGAFDFLDTAGA